MERVLFRKLNKLQRRRRQGEEQLDQLQGTVVWKKSIRQATKYLFRRKMKPVMKEEQTMKRQEKSQRREKRKERRMETDSQAQQEQPRQDDKKKKKKRQMQAISTTPTTTLDCSLLKQTRNIWKRRGDAANADTAYRMAILSSLAYWEFHKHPQSNNLTSFRLQTDIPKKHKSLGQSAQVALCHVASGVSNSVTIVEQYKNPNQQQHSCRHVVQQQHNSGIQYDLQWYLYNWHEPTPLAGKWHDTDLLVATSGDDTLVLSFAGTASAADAVTNVQTFEKVTHSRLFQNEGSIHRGFLNAYSRVERGQVYKIASQRQSNNLTHSLQQRYGDCYLDSDADNTDESANNNTFAVTKDKKKRKRPKCRGRDENLMIILRELVNSALVAGHKIHLVGHSLGGGIATLLALDVIINFPSVPISKLHLWTFGAPQVADDVFLQSAMDASPRFKAFVQKKRKRRYHRYVTLSDKCKADVVSTIASKALPSHKRGLHGHLVRRLGGLRGRVVHIAEPHYLPPLISVQTTNNATAVNMEEEVPTKTSSTLGAHRMSSYLQGISRESPSHPLRSNLPVHVAEFIGEVPPQKRVTNTAITA